MTGISSPPDLVLVGHVARDVLPDGGWRLGGAVAFAGLAALRLGLRVGIVTSAPPDLAAALRVTLPAAELVIVPSAEATCFENVYRGGARTQRLRSRAAPLGGEAVPKAWQSAPLVMLAPIAQEVAPELIERFPRSLLAATGQGWLRTWDAGGHVTMGSFAVPSTLLPRLDLLTISAEDIATAPVDLLAAWSRAIALVAVTRGAEGADVYHHGLGPRRAEACVAHEVDPTGAGDVFAVALLVALWRGGTPDTAAQFACQVAALAVEAPGLDAVPTREAMLARYPELAGSPLLG